MSCIPQSKETDLKTPSTKCVEAIMVVSKATQRESERCDESCEQTCGQPEGPSRCKDLRESLEESSVPEANVLESSHTVASKFLMAGRSHIRV